MTARHPGLRTDTGERVNRRSCGRIGALSILVLGLSVLPALPAVAACAPPAVTAQTPGVDRGMDTEVAQITVTFDNTLTPAERFSEAEVTKDGAPVQGVPTIGPDGKSYRLDFSPPLDDGDYSVTIPPAAVQRTCTPPLGSLEPSDTAAPNVQIDWTFLVDTTVPGEPGIVSDDVNAASAGSHEHEIIVEDLEAGETVTITVSGDGFPDLIATETMSADGDADFKENLSGFDDGELSVVASVVDRANNESPDGELIIDKDVVVPEFIERYPAPGDLIGYNDVLPFALFDEPGEAGDFTGVDFAAANPANDPAVFSARVVDDESTGGALLLIDYPEEQVLADDTYTVTVPAGAVTDLVGNPNAAFSWSFEIDATAPAAPTIEFRPASINAANEHAVVVGGVAEPGSTVYVALDQQEYGEGSEPGAYYYENQTVSDPSTGAWSVTFDVSELFDGPLYALAEACDEAGNCSELSDLAFADKLVHLPAVPQDVEAYPWDESAWVVWDQYFNLGEEPTSYTVKISPGDRTVTRAAVDVYDEGAFLVEGLRNGTSYTFQVAATNRKGTSNWSTTSDPVSPSDRDGSDSNGGSGGGGGGGGGRGGGGGGGGGGTPRPRPTPTPPRTDPAPGPLVDSDALQRVSGADRSATAVDLAQRVFGLGTQTVYLAPAGGFADALAGGPAAAKDNAPVLLTNRDTLSTSTRELLERIRPQRIVLLGGPNAISDAVATAVAPLTSEVTRLSGPDRFATAAAISAASFPRARTVYIASGSGFADALSGGAAAAASGSPVLLTQATALPEATARELRRLAPEHIVVLGGSSAVSAEVEASLRAFAPDVQRRSGPDRYATSAAIVAAAFPSTVETVMVATGEDFPDALAAVAAAGAQNAPLLLVRPGEIPGAVAEQLRRLAPSRLYVLGGTRAVSADTEAALRQYTAG